MYTSRMSDDPFIPLPRRAALQLLVGAAGAGFTSGSEAAHPMHLHVLNGANSSTIERAQQKAAAAGSYTPELLDAHQLKTLEALAEAIVPGSTAARVAPFLDQLLAVDAAATQRAFLGSIGAFDMAAIKKHGKAWTLIAASDQDALLREASTAEPSTALRSHFEELKGWIAGAYYSSEAGMRELGWNGNVFHQELPGCTHAEGHKE